jgi:phage-related protein
MEIGLTAKVTPKVDERSAKREASAFKSQLEDAVSDIEFSVDISEVSDQMEDMKEQVENVSEHTKSASSNFSDMQDTIDNFDTDVLEELSTGGFAQDVLFTQSSTPQGEGFDPRQSELTEGRLENMVNALGDVKSRLDDGFGRLTSASREQAAGLVEMVAQQQSVSAILNTLGRTFKGKGGKVALAGLGLLLLGQIASSTVKNSPLLSTVVDMFSMAMGLFFRPFGNILGRYLLPIASAALRLAAGFNTVFNNEGIIVALGWLARRLIEGLATSAVFGTDREFGIADAFRIALGAAITKSLISGVLRSAIGKIAGSSIAKFLFPRTTMIASILNKRLGLQLGKVSIGATIRSGLSRIFASVASRVPSVGALLGRFLPSISGKAILSKIGLTAITKFLTGRLAYLIPVVGQAIAIIDLLTLAITAILPGVEAFSPLTWLLTKLYQAGVGFLGWLTQVPGMLSNLSVSGAQEFLGDIVSTLMNYILPVLESFSPFFTLLGLFAVKAIEFYNALMDITWEDIVKFLQELKEKIVKFGGDVLGDVTSRIREAGSELYDTVVKGADEFFTDVVDGAEDVKDDIIEGAEDLKNDIVNGASNLKDDITSAASDFKEDVVNSASDFKQDVIQSAKDLKEDIIQGAKDFKNDIVSGANEFKNDVVNGAKDFKDGVLQGASNLKNDIVSGANNLKNDVTSAASDLKSDVVTAASGFLSDIQESANGFLNDVQSSASDLASNVRNSASDLASDVRNSASDLKNDVLSAASDFINNVSIDDFANYVSGSINLDEYVSRGIGSLSDYVSSGIGSLSNYVEGGITAARDIIDFPDIDLIDYITEPDFGEFDIDSYIDEPGFGEFDIDSYIDEPGFGEFEIADYLDFDIPDVDVDIPDINVSESRFDLPFIEVDEFRFQLPFIDLADNITVPEIEFEENRFGNFVGDLVRNVPLATGGIVTGPTRALIGEGAESEAVLPLSRLESLINTPSTPDMTGGTSVELNVSGGGSEILDGTDEDSLAQSIAQALTSEFNDLSVSMDEVRNEIKRLRRNQNVKITADGKVIAEISEKNKDRYTRSRNITR